MTALATWFFLVGMTRERAALLCAALALCRGLLLAGDSVRRAAAHVDEVLRRGAVEAVLVAWRLYAPPCLWWLRLSCTGAGAGT